VRLFFQTAQIVMIRTFAQGQRPRPTLETNEVTKTSVMSIDLKNPKGQPTPLISHQQKNIRIAR